MARPWRVEPDGVTVAVRLTPRGGADRIDGQAELADGRLALKARVSAPPEDGKANAALLHLIAASCGVAPRSVSLLAGQTARLKSVRIVGDPATIAARLDALLPADPKEVP